MDGALEQLAHEASLRALDKQERLLEELRARTGILLAASSIAVSFLGDAVLGQSSTPVLEVAAVVAFVISMGASVYILVPDRDLSFALSGPGLYAAAYDHRTDMARVHRDIALELHFAWENNSQTVVSVAKAYRIAAVALIVELVLLALLLGVSII
jgi:hypothetical protein